MFERFTEKARRAIFFARYEASQFGSAFIEPAHLLLGLLREHKAEFSAYMNPGVSLAEARAELEKTMEKHPRYSTSIELPLSADAKRVLTFASTEAELLNSPRVGPEHILLGVLRVDSPAAQMLSQKGIRFEAVRGKIAIHAQLFQTVKARFPESPDAALRAFLRALKELGREELIGFFAPFAQFVDASGKRWAGRTEIEQGLEALLAPYAKRNSVFHIEEPFVWSKEVCVAYVLWENVVRSGEALKPLLRMTLFLASDVPHWRIIFLQVTPVVRTF